MKPIGYQYLLQLLNYKCIEHFRSSWLGTRHTCDKGPLYDVYTYPKSYALKDMSDPLQHLEFALKHEGLHLLLIEKLFQFLPKSVLYNRIKQKTTGTFERRLWYLYESLTQNKLDIPNLTVGNYIDLIDSKLYFTAEKPERIRRHRVRHNLLGSFDFCPMVRKTALIGELQEENLGEQMLKLTQTIDPRIMTRAIHYLFSKETFSSWEIEREKPSKQKAKQYIEHLQACAFKGIPTKADMIAWQNVIIDERFVESNYRSVQNYVGFMMRDFSAHVEYIPPKPCDIPRLMNGLLKVLEQDQQLAVILAAICSFGLVFIHPFKDGNGRLHRLLLHAILSQQNYTPKGMIFPLSATMLKHIGEYESILQSYSRPLMKLIDYEFNHNQLQVKSDTFYLYRSWDMTRIVEYTYQCIEKTLYEEFTKEIEYLQGYDKVQQEIKTFGSLSEYEIDLMIRFITQNHGCLSKQKRKKYFSHLDDQVIEDCAEIIKRTLT